MQIQIIEFAEMRIQILKFVGMRICVSGNMMRIRLDPFCTLDNKRIRNAETEADRLDPKLWFQTSL